MNLEGLPQNISTEKNNTYKKLKRVLLATLIALSFDGSSYIPDNVLKTKHVLTTTRPKLKKDNPQRKHLQKLKSNKNKEEEVSETQDGAINTTKQIPNDAKRAFEEYDKQREWLANTMFSEEYEKRAKAEGLTDKEITERRAKSIEDKILLEDPDHPLSRETNSHYEKIGEYDPEKDEIVVKYGETKDGERYENNPTGIHEGEHLVTKGGKLLSKKALELYHREGGYIKVNDKELDAYLSDPAEIDARKRVFEYDLEKNGIWRYGESFTEDHLKKALQLKEEGRLYQGSEEFLDRIEHGLIIEIMNTLAKNNITAEENPTKTA